MDCSAEQDVRVVEVNGEPELPTNRRRLVQKTLFPHRSPGVEERTERTAEKDCGADDEGEDRDEECRGSQGKKKRPNRKTMSRPRASKKACVNGKEALSMKVDDKDSPVGDDKQSPRRLKMCVNTTPIKNVTANGLKKKMTSGQVTSEPATLSTPDLRLEAKMIAEENSRIFAGKKIHPFFSSWKVSKRCSEATDPDNNGCLVEKRHRDVTFRPIHVFERIQDDDVSVDWKSWIFYERSIANASCALETASLSVFEGSTESLDFDNFPNAPNSTLSSDFQSEESVDPHPTRLNLNETSGPFSTMSANEQVEYNQLLKSMEINQDASYVGLLTGHYGGGRNMDIMPPSRFLQESMVPYYLSCGDQPEDSLWTNKYQPEKAVEVCGNSESIKLLSEWLHLWHVKDLQLRKKAISGDKCIKQDSDYNFPGSNSDSDLDEDTGLKNVLLVTGPIGSGKSAAIYACAKEQGFRIIEINTSDLRSGTVVKQRIGEALESHGLKRSLENPIGSQSKILKSFLAPSDSTPTQELNNKVYDPISSIDEEDSHDTIWTPKKHLQKKNRVACDQGETMTLILFEDVDITFPEDRSLISTIQQLAETAKRPIILTSNSNNPVLPDNLDRLEVYFTLPSPKELLCHAYMVCAAEKTNIHPWLIKRFISYCQGDIRKTLMHLQFWCQGKRCRQGRKAHKIYGPLTFDLEAGHQILPRLIPWDFPSQLSELVEKEIAKSLSKIEEDSNSVMVIKEGGNSRQMSNGLDMHDHGKDNIESKKEAMFARNCSVNDGNGLAAEFDIGCELSNSSGSPAAFIRRNVRRKLDTVLSSNSEDEVFTDSFPVVSHNLLDATESGVFLDIGSKFSPNVQESNNCMNVSTDWLLHSEEGKLEENRYQCSETANSLCIYDTCKSFDLSQVPESSFVPETEMNGGTELVSMALSCGRVADIAEAVSICSGFRQNLSPVETENPENTVPELSQNLVMMVNGETVQEEVGDSQNEHVESVTRGFPVADECSRMAFTGGPKSLEDPESCTVTNLVDETWRKLHSFHTDLKQYAMLEKQRDVSQIVELTYKISNLISEADQLQYNCHSLDSDSLDLSTVLCPEESYSFSWYDEQLQMASTTAQHGFCLFAKHIGAVGSASVSEHEVDLASEMLACTTNTMALGKLSRPEMRTGWTSRKGVRMELPERDPFLRSELEPSLRNIIRSVVPSKSYLGVKGLAFHEYLSSLSQISRSGASRSSGSPNQNKRRGRRRSSQHYLSAAACLSPGDISLLSQSNCYGQNSSKQQLQDPEKKT